MVVLSKDFYHSQISEMFDDGTYRLLDKDPTQPYIDQLETLVDMGFRTGGFWYLQAVVFQLYTLCPRPIRI